MNTEESWDIPIEEFEWRMQRSINTQDGPRGIYVAYPDARTVAKHLDRIFGPAGWSDEYEITEDKKAVICRLSLEMNGIWIIKSDVGHMTDIESHKGGFSDAFKRAAAKAGIGRNAYEIPEIKGPVREFKEKFYMPFKAEDGRSFQEWLVDRAYAFLTGTPPEPESQVAPEVAPAPVADDFEVPQERWDSLIESIKSLTNDGKETMKEWWSNNGTGTSKPSRDIDKETFVSLSHFVSELVVKESLGATEVGKDDAPW